MTERVMPDQSGGQPLSESELVAFFGALFSMAEADGHMDQEEIGLIFDLISVYELSEEAHQEIRGHLRYGI